MMMVKRALRTRQKMVLLQQSQMWQQVSHARNSYQMETKQREKKKKTGGRTRKKKTCTKNRKDEDGIGKWNRE